LERTVFKNPPRRAEVFWTHKKTEEGGIQLPGPKDLPQFLASHLVAQEKKEPDWVWTLKMVIRPTEKKKVFYCRLFSEAEAAKAGVKVKDWRSLDGHSALILWEGYFDKETNMVRREKFATPPISSN
jgi:hypothetical protein